MAWRIAGKKGIRANLAKALTVAFTDSVVPSSKFQLERAQASVRALAKQIHAYGFTPQSTSCDDFNFLTNKNLIRSFHATPQLLGRLDDEIGWGLKSDRKGKYKKKPKSSTPPVEAPYVPPKPKRPAKSRTDKTIEIFEGMTVIELSKLCGESISTIQSILVNVGEKVDSEFDSLGIDLAELVAMEIGINVRKRHTNEGANLVPRSPVVTVMGHVDHGKTSLLDALRKTSVAAQEAGGITQHLGAFVVGMQSGESITFLDTPGHAAFSAMRARGAAITDIVVLVVAADDGIMPQTLEAISHANAAGVPIVVAINKCDKPQANPERVKRQLASEGMALEDVGGDIQVVEVSATKGTGLDKLEEALLLQAALMDLKARVDGPAQAYVVEARLDKGRGPLATAIVKAGTIVPGQCVVVGAEWGRIRVMRDTLGNFIDCARPAMPVEIEGLKGLPMAGDDITVVHSEERARMLSEGRKKKRERDRLTKMDEKRQEVLEKEKAEAEENKEEKECEDETIAGGERRGWHKGKREKRVLEKEDKPRRPELPIIVKADVQGTVEAVIDALRSLNSPQLPVVVIHNGVGPISQSDVDMAKACDACIVGFNVGTIDYSITQAANQAKVQVKLHKIIYRLLEDIGRLIVEVAPGTPETKVYGEAQVLNIFEVQGRGKLKGVDVKIAGCRVVTGQLERSSTMRILRSGEVIFEGCCASLKKEKHDVDAVDKGNECGLVIHDCFDYKIGDVIQCMKQVNVKPKFVISQNGAVRMEG
ncbi:OLC1v1029936C1 [Oldenlandia corymbosa var. corymbosa]|uniref:Translation initiation factor IF-2, mitochondrial n=1 Tax=Oldenlandia corymbosa var. corymbosa TaxID=529605 RepID=A0AAV1CFW0_OLDCO|nr:OLC1v1029936C1 [Oldenlandia corymbosa var. corymbosa]